MAVTITDPAPAPTNGTSNCLTQWKEDLEAAEQVLRMKSAEAAKIKRKLQLATTWRDRLFNYWQNIQETDVIANDIKRSLTSFKDQNDKVCCNTEYGIMASKLLVCDVEDVFEKADELEGLLNGLIDAIKTINEPKLTNPEISRFYACLDNLKELLGIVIEYREKALSQSLKAVKISDKLHRTLCDENHGLKTNITELLEQFKGEIKPTTSSSSKKSAKVSRKMRNMDTKSCMAEIDPVTFPINCDEYYTKTEQQYETAKTEVEDLISALDEINKDKDAALSRRDSLKDAIEAAEKALACK